MNPSSASGKRQPDLISISKRPTIPLAEEHQVVQMTDTLDWTEMEDRAQRIRSSKLKNAAGRPPHLRVLLGAMVFMAIRKLTYREAEDLIRYYAPARYLCGLTETEWTPDFTTIPDLLTYLRLKWPVGGDRGREEADRWSASAGGRGRSGPSAEAG